MESKIFKQLCAEALRLGAYKSKIINACDVSLDRSFRDMCRQNACGMYGKCYTCPPDVGNIDELMSEVKMHEFALVFQTVTEIEDSFDYEGMIEAKRSVFKVSHGLKDYFERLGINKSLHLSAGGCDVCEVCAKVTDEPCRFPELALKSLEAYGVNVSKLAAAADMKYVNGRNTVTYFGAVLFSDERTVTVYADGKYITALSGTLLSEAINVEKPCGGHGKCGKCKVLVHGELSPPSSNERALLTEDELSRGVRLACLARVIGDCTAAAIVTEKEEQVVTSGELPDIELNPVFEQYGVAIDIGTTTLAGRLYNTDGKLLSTAASINPQQKWGADVVSRIEAALSGYATELAETIREAVCLLISALASDAGTDASNIDSVVVTGNTVMLTLLTEGDTEPFSHAPFEIERLFGETLKASEIGLGRIDPNTPVYIPPCISAFVGADISCAVLSTQMCDSDTAMLVDIGTNGEMVLWHDGKLSVCSTAAGPAFEGVGISVGMRGADGAIDKITVENGSIRVHVIGDTDPVGICGSGIIDAVSAMLELGVMDETGYLENETFPVSDNLSLTQNDVRMVQLSKSAVCAGLLTLAEAVGLKPSDIHVLYVAGGFGNYLNMESSAGIGLLPKVMAERSKTVGNAALSGASMLLLDKNHIERINAIVSMADAVELSTSKFFSDCFISGMMLEEV